jgi:divalent metal cation (Fe/Co/Zn/Cd) transporter
LRDQRIVYRNPAVAAPMVGSDVSRVGNLVHHNGAVTKRRMSEASLRRGVHLEWATNAWNFMEVVVTISLGLQAGSLALIAFGLDSIIEIFASTVVIRNLRDERADPGDRRVHRSLRLIAAAFWVLAAFLVVISVRGLILGDRPDSSPLGVAYLALTAVAMFGLSLLKRSTARKLGSETLQAEAALTFLDGCLSMGILTALVLNAWLGWWWTDAAAALLVAAFAIKEGVDHWRESAPHEMASEPRDAPATTGDDSP